MSGYNTKRRFLAALLAAALLLSLAALSGCGKEEEDDGRLRIVTTIFPQYDFVRQIGGDRVNARMLLTPDTEVHGFEPTLEDLADIQRSDLFIYVGGESEKWVDSLLEEVGDKGGSFLALTDVVATVEEETVEGMESEAEEAEEGEAEEEIDEHVWTSPRRAALIAQAICDEMCRLDPENAEFYRAGADALLFQLGALDSQLTEVVENAERNTVVFAERFPFRYLAEDYGLEYYAAFSGCSSNTEPSLATIAFLTEKVSSEKLPVVFYIEFSKQTVAGTICEATGAKKLMLHSCHNLTKDELERGETYVTLMTQNIENLREALN